MTGRIDGGTRASRSYSEDASFDQGFSRKDGTVGKSDATGRIDSGERRGAASGVATQTVSSDGVGRDALVRQSLRRARQARLPGQPLKPMKTPLSVAQRGGGIEAKADGKHLHLKASVGDTSASEPNIALKVPTIAVEGHWEEGGESMGAKFELRKVGFGVTVSARDTDGDGKPDVTAFKWELGPITLTHQGRHVEGQPAGPESGTEGGSGRHNGSGGSSGR
ncbi:MAG TPA: hypothetical protein PKA88_05915 [Polyangiaceae bacterium]|nr:hypothetical protein [Polyangiaceae bacterium]